MKESYERDLNHAWMLLEVDQIYQEDYQMRMLMENDVPGLLTVCGQGRKRSMEGTGDRKLYEAVRTDAV